MAFMWTGVYNHVIDVGIQVNDMGTHVVSMCCKLLWCGS